MSVSDASLANLHPPRFAPGNQDALKHGAYSLAAVQPRAQEVADALRAHVPRFTERLEPLLNMTALHAARIERAEAWLAKHGDLDRKGRLQPVHARLSTWYAELRRCLTALGMDNTGTVTSAAAVDLAMELVRVAAVESEAEPEAADA